MNRIIRNTGFYLIIFLVIIGIVHVLSSQGEQSVELTYDQFREQVQNNHVEEVTAQFDGYTYLIKGTLSSPVDGMTEFYGHTPIGERLFDLLEENKVKFDVDPMEETSIWVSFLT